MRLRLNKRQKMLVGYYALLAVVFGAAILLLPARHAPMKVAPEPVAIALALPESAARAPGKTWARVLPGATGEQGGAQGWVGLSPPSPLKGARRAGKPPSNDTAASEAPILTVILDDMGLSPRQTEVLMQSLPVEIAFSFLPYGPDVPAQARAVRADGRDVLLHLPMEPLGRADAGPRPLRVDQSEAEIAETLDWALGQVPGAIAINNHMGSRFTGDAAAMRRLARALSPVALPFINSRTAPDSLAQATLAAAGFETAARDFFLDHNGGSEAELALRLARAADHARRTGAALVIAHPHPDTIAALRAWPDSAAAAGVRLAGVAAYLARGRMPPTPQQSLRTAQAHTQAAQHAN